MYSHSRGDKKIQRVLKKRRAAIEPDVVLERPKPLKMRSFRQRESYCGPVCVQIVAKYFDLDFDEAEVGNACNTTVENGTSHEGLIVGAEKLGAKVFAMHRGDISDLRYFLHEGRLPVIVAWYSPGRPRFKKYREGADYAWGHYSVVYHISRTHVYLMDPDDGRKYRYSIPRFLFLWWDTDSEKKICVRHWFMVASFR